jgi:hypothetical protein
MTSMDHPTTMAGTALTPLDRALARLADTRARLRQELLPPEDSGRPDHPEGSAASSVWPPRLRAGWRHWRRQLRRWPLTGALLAGAQDTWKRHPWRPTAEMVLQQAGAAILPAVRRHPVAAVALAAGLGMAVVAGRRWYAPALQGQVRSAPARLGRWLLRQLGQAPVQAGLVGLLAMLAQRGWAAPADAPPSATPAPGAEPGAAGGTAAPGV